MAKKKNVAIYKLYTTIYIDPSRRSYNRIVIVHPYQKTETVGKVLLHTTRLKNYLGAVFHGDIKDVKRFEKTLYTLDNKGTDLSEKALLAAAINQAQQVGIQVIYNKNDLLMKENTIIKNIETSSFVNKLLTKDIYEKVENLKTDLQKEKRLRKQECKVCFYGVKSRIGGQAITASNCNICGKEILNSNTNINIICLECAEKYKICKHCGATLDDQI